MSWEKLPLLGASAALLLTVFFIRVIFVVPDFDFWFFDIFLYLFLFLLDIYLVGYIRTAGFGNRFVMPLLFFWGRGCRLCRFIRRQADNFCGRILLLTSEQQKKPPLIKAALS